MSDSLAQRSGLPIPARRLRPPAGAPTRAALLTGETITTLDAAAAGEDHLISPEERLHLALARQ
jgi:hypothetical protein